jgi:hypothetical protein
VLLERGHGFDGIPVKVEPVHEQGELFIRRDDHVRVQFHATDFLRVGNLIFHGSLTGLEECLMI